MKKEVLLSLLMTTPVAFPALALDIPLLSDADGRNWNPKTSDATIKVTPSENMEGLTCPAGIQQISRVVSLSKGSYQIKLMGSKNAVLALSGDGIKVDTPIVANETSKTFKVTAENANVTITITPKDSKNGFSFDRIEFDLDFDMAGAIEAIQVEKNKVPSFETIKSHQGQPNTSATVTTLNTAKTALENRIKAANVKLANVESDDPEVALKAYSDYKLYNGSQNALVQEYAKIAADVKDHNDKVKAENVRFATHVDNVIAKDRALTSQNNFAADVKRLKDLIDDNKDDQVVKDGKYADRTEKLTTKINELKTLVNTTYADAKLDNPIDASAVDAEIRAIDAELYDMLGYLNGADQNVAAYNNFRDTNNFAALDNAYHAALVSLSEIATENKTPAWQVSSTAGFAERVASDAEAIQNQYKAVLALIKTTADGLPEYYYDKETQTNKVLLKTYSGAADTDNEKGKAQQALEQIESALQGISTLLSDWNAYKADQVTEMNDAYNLYNSNKTAINNLENELSLPAQFKEGHDKVYNAVVAANNAITTGANNAYGKIAKDSYKENPKAYKDAFTAFSTYCGSVEKVCEVNAAFETLKKNVKAVDVEIEDGTGIYFLKDKVYSKNFADITDAIAKLDPAKIDAKAVASIKTLIENLDVASEPLVKAFDKANIGNDYDEFKEHVKEARILDTVETDVKGNALNVFTNKPNKDTKSLEEQIEAINERLDKVIKDFDPDYVLNATSDINKIGDDAAPLKTKIATERVTFNKALVAANVAAVQSELDALNEKLTNENLIDLDKKGNLASAKNKVTELRNLLTAAASTATTSTDEKTLIDLNSTVIDKYHDGKDSKVVSIPAIKKLVEKSLANYDAYIEMTDALDELNEAIGQAVADNMSMSLEAAKEHFTTVIGKDDKAGYKKSAKEYGDKIVAAQNPKDGEKDHKYCSDIKEETLKSIKNTLADVNRTREDIINNRTSFNEQTAKLSGVRTTIESIEKKLKDTADEGKFNPFSEKLQAAKEELQKINDALSTAHKNGVAHKAENDKSAEISTLADTVNSLFAAFDTDYNAALREANNKAFETLWTNGYYKSLNDNYKTSVDNYQSYVIPDKQNKGYQDFIDNAEEGFGDISALFAIQPKIGELNNNLEAWKLTLISENASESKQLDQATIDAYLNTLGEDNPIGENGLINQLKNVGNDIVAKAKTLADGYLTEKGWHASAFQILAGNKKMLDDACIKDYKIKDGNTVTTVLTVQSDAMKSVTNSYNAAMTLLYEKNSTTKKLATYALNMHTIADNFDKVVAFNNDDLKDFAATMWEKSYEEAVKYVNNLKTEVAAYEYVTNTEKKTAADAFSAAIKSLSELNTAAGKEKALATTTISKLAGTDGYLAKLEAAVAKAKTDSKYSVLKTKEETKAASNQTYQDLLKEIGKAQDSFEALYDAVNGVGHVASAEKELAAVKASLNQIESDNKTGLQSDYTVVGKETIENKLTEFGQQTIPDTYAHVAADAVSAIYNKYTALKSEWSRLNEEGKTTPDMWSKIDNACAAFEAGVFAQALPLKNAHITTKEQLEAVKALIKEIKAAQSEVSGLDVELRTVGVAKTPVTTALETLKQSIEAKLVLPEDKYAESVRNSEDAKALAAYQGQLDHLQAGWESTENSVIMLQGNFTAAMNAIDAKVDALLVKINAAQKVINDNAAANTRLSNELKAQTDLIAALKARLTDDAEFFEWIPTEKDGEIVFVLKNNYDTRIANLEAYAAKLANELANRFNDGKGSMNETTTWEQIKPSETVDNVTTTYEFSTLKSYVSDINGEIVTEIYANVDGVVKDALQVALTKIQTSNILPAVKADLINQHKELQKKSGEIDSYTKLPAADKNDNAKVEKAKLETVANAHALISQIEALVAEGQKNTYKLGDVDNDGEVTIFDVQEIAALVGDRVDYSELYASDPVKAVAANVVADNGEQKISSADLAEAINLMMGRSNASGRLARAAVRASVEESSNFISTAFVSEEAGVRRYAVSILNSAALVAGQIDLQLGEGVTLVDVVAADRAESHEVALFHHGVDSKRVVLFNMDNAVIEGQNGAVVYVDVIGDGAVAIEEAIFADRDANSYRLAKPEGTSGIEDTVIDNNGGLKQRIYNAAGQALRGIQRGVNIIRNADGSVTKELH